MSLISSSGEIVNPGIYEVVEINYLFESSFLVSYLLTLAGENGVEILLGLREFEVKIVPGKEIKIQIFPNGTQVLQVRSSNPGITIDGIARKIIRQNRVTIYVGRDLGQLLDAKD